GYTYVEEDETHEPGHAVPRGAPARPPAAPRRADERRTRPPQRAQPCPRTVRLPAAARPQHGGAARDQRAGRAAGPRRVDGHPPGGEPGEGRVRAPQPGPPRRAGRPGRGDAGGQAAARARAHATQRALRRGPRALVAARARPPRRAARTAEPGPGRLPARHGGVSPRLPKNMLQRNACKESLAILE